MARRPKKLPDDAQTERLIPLRGWVYNLMIDIGQEQGRDAKYQIAFELEQLARKYRRDRERREQEPGNSEPLPIAA